LKFDLMVILITQTVALSWGTWWVFSERPALTVFYDGEFICMNLESGRDQRICMGQRGY